MITRHKRSQTESSISVHSLQNVQEAIGAWPEAGGSPTVSSQQTLSQAVWQRRGEFTRPDTFRLKVGTWNVGAKQNTEYDVAKWFVGGKGVAEGLTTSKLNGSKDKESADEQESRPRSKQSCTLPLGDDGNVPGGSDIGLYALGLQEVVDVNSAYEHVRPTTDPAAANRYKTAIESALPSDYVLVAEQQLVGMLLLIWAAPNLAPHIGSVSSTSVGTGGGSWLKLGNKGAVTTRIVLGESTRIVFVNCHLSAGNTKADLERRNHHAEQIVASAKFEPIVDSLGISAPHGEKIGDEDFAFWFGDLNYRLEGIPGDDVRRLLMLHTRNEYDIGQQREQTIERDISESTERLQEANLDGGPSKGVEESPRPSSSHSSVTSSAQHTTFSAASAASTEDEPDVIDPNMDPASLVTTLNSLLPHDELHQQMKARKMFHDGWQEGQITFLPTYKYDVGSVGRFDSSDKHRGPSWCDRIIFRTRKDKEQFHQKIDDEADARRRDEELKSKGIDKAAEDEDTLFDYDPEADAEPEEITGDEEDFPQLDGAGPRLITKEGYEDILALEYYLSHQRVLSSDHKPLEAIFTLKYDAIIPELKAKIHQEVARELDRAENEARPVVTLVVDGDADDDATKFDGVNFGSIRYDEANVATVTLANNGSVTASFGLVNRPVGMNLSERPTPEWLICNIDLDGSRVASSALRRKDEDSWDADIDVAYKIEPGETCTILLTAHVKGLDMLRKFNHGVPLEDVLVLRVKDGRDHFLPVHGKWQPSIFGRTVEKLAQVPEGGIRKHIEEQTRREASGDAEETLRSATMWSAPREVYRLTADIEALSERLLAEWSMLASEQDEAAPWSKVAGWPFAKESWTMSERRRQSFAVDIREALDTDASFDACLREQNLQPREKVQVWSYVLISLLKSLEDGVVTADTWAKIDAEFFARRTAEKAPSQTVDEQKAAILEILSSSRSHSVSFVLLTSMQAHLVLEVSGALQDAPAFSGNERARTELLLDSPRVSIRRKALSQDLNVARKQLIRKNFAAIFADAMIRVPGTGSEQAKRWKESEERRRDLIEMFLGD